MQGGIDSGEDQITHRKMPKVMGQEGDLMDRIALFSVGDSGIQRATSNSSACGSAGI